MAASGAQQTRHIAAATCWIDARTGGAGALAQTAKHGIARA